ncbi:MFS general substrate transporter [Byssothecium circinans]|uniref:MFS general substrate transporter n=1 Tax=Byssothecium circinans TaxID=147558 RepID=A0A6A5TPC4_9PLEO|nr:MFS general substrate transporter [Byssothecium circinans]
MDTNNNMAIDEHETLIDFEGPDDPHQPLNWQFGKKVVITLLYSLCTMGSTWASAIYNSGLSQVQAQFHVSEVVALLGMSLYLLGNALGPLLWAPMSEVYGRKMSVLLPIFGLATIFICRFFAGVFGGSPLSNVGGVLTDIWPPTQRGAALLMWGMAVIVGPLVAPIVGAALVINLPEMGWRWTGYLTGIILVVILVLSLIWIDESFAPAIHSKSQEVGTSLREIGKKYMIVPLQMMVDPIALFINLYSAFCYAIIYLAVTAVPYEFMIIRHWNSVLSSATFFAMVIGVLFAAVVLLWGQIFYKKRFITNGNKMIPEARLLPMMIGSIFFPPGLFIMGWTGRSDMHWIGLCVGSALVAFGFFTIFQSAVSYIVETYLMQAASALAANIFMRSVLAAAFPLFARALFVNLGLDWGLSLLGFIAVAMVPIPFLFYLFGKRIRAVGKLSKKAYMP